MRKSGLNNSIMLKLRFYIFKMVLSFLNRYYLRLQHKSELISTWLGDIDRRCTHRGTVDTIAYIKSVRLACTRYLCGEPLTESPGNGVKLDQRGLPQGVSVAELFSERDPSHVRLGLTLLGVSRTLPGWKSPDLAPIIDPPRVFSPQIEVDLKAIVTELGWKMTTPVWEAPHVTTKSGPNTQALIGSVEDAQLLSDAQISDLRILGGDLVVQQLESIRSLNLLTWLSKFSKLKPNGRLSKLSLVKDKEAKVRIVAILDYWTQSVLLPLHQALMSKLRGLKPDMTFNQGGFRVQLGQGPYHSLDLTAATDRFPVSLQEAVLATMISPEYAAAWRRCIVDRDYWYRWTGQWLTVRYATGQPMGAYSSWAMFAVTHHAVVRLAAKRAGLTVRFSNYALLGDDIVIANDAVAKEYRAILASIGVSVSETKTHVSKDTYEFAKRWILRGTEVTGAPLGSLFEAITFVKHDVRGHKLSTLPSKMIKNVSFYGVAIWFREIEARWLPRSYTLVSRGLLASFFLLLGRAGMSYRLAEKAWKFYLLPSREDSRQVRMWKTHELGRLLLPGLLGCASWGRTSKVKTLLVLLNECKARVLEEALKRQIGELRRFQLEGSRFLDLAPEGVDAQSLLLALPPFAVLRRNIAELQLEFDKAQAVRESDSILQWLHLEVRLFLDPFAVLRTRRSKTVASCKTTIMNYLTSMCRGIETTRELALTSIDLSGLLSFIANNDVTPTRGDRRRAKVQRPKVEIPANVIDVTGFGPDPWT